MSSPVDRTGGPRIRDWLVAGGAICCALALWAWWMGLGGWRLTYWAKRTAATAGPCGPSRGGSAPTDLAGDG